MEVLNHSFDFDSFWKSVAESRQSLLMLDYDGTLAPFTRDPMAAFPYPGIRDQLTRIIAHSRTRLVMVSGRPIDDLIVLLDIDPLPEIWGSHGLEHRETDGTRTLRAFPKKTREGFDAIRRFVDRKQLHPLTEYKLSGAAFHWRSLDPPEAELLRRALHDQWDSAAWDFGFEVHEFDGGLELRVAGVSKANAVNAVLARAAADTPAAFLGDDLTDEDGFRALQGRGLAVLVRTDFRDTLADLWITPPADLLNFFDHWYSTTGEP